MKEMMKKICECGDIFEVEANPKGRGKGRHHKEKLCLKCWTKARKNCTQDRKERKKFGQRGSEGFKWINTKSNVLGGLSKNAREMVLLRNEKIDELNRILKRVIIENIKLKEELHIIKQST